MRNYETKIFDYIDKKTGVHVVKAMTMYAGKHISACSKCDPNDTFNLEFGRAVALKRLDAKIAWKRHISMVAYTKLCRQRLEQLEAERRRAKKAVERAEIAALDRKVEAKTFEAEIASMLSALD